VYLVDTDVISEARKGHSGQRGRSSILFASQ
jgi:hypothetical protein